MCTVNITFVSACDWWPSLPFLLHSGDVIMGAITSQITSLTIVYSTVYSHADQRKHQSSASLVFVRGIHRGPVNCPHKWPVTRIIFPFDDAIMQTCSLVAGNVHGYNLQQTYFLIDLICFVVFQTPPGHTTSSRGYFLLVRCNDIELIWIDLM